MSGDSDLNKLKELNDRIKKAKESADFEAKAKSDLKIAQSRRAIRVIRVGSDFVAVVVLFGCAGWFLDGQLDTQPWLMLAGLIIGFVAGFWMLVRLLIRKKPTSEGKE